MFRRPQIDLNNFHNTANVFLRAGEQLDQLNAVRDLLEFAQQQAQSEFDVFESSEDKGDITPDHRPDSPRSAASSQRFEDFTKVDQGPDAEVVKRFKLSGRRRMLDDDKLNT